MKNKLHALQKFAIFFFVIEGFYLVGGIINGGLWPVGSIPVYWKLFQLAISNMFLWIGLVLWFVGRRKQG